MIITLVAVLCHTLSGAPEPICVEEIVTNSQMSGITWMSCQISAQQGIAKWMSENSKYSADIQRPAGEGPWYISEWKCITGKYQIHRET
jgi:hypothetical protein